MVKNNPIIQVLSFIPETPGTCNCVSVHWKHMPEHMWELKKTEGGGV